MFLLPALLLLLLLQAEVVAVMAAAAAPLHLGPGQRLLMIDGALLSSPSEAVELRMHAPRKTGEVVIKADKPWEDVIFYYDSIVQVSATEFRIYYDAFGPLGRFMCVAVSNDTLTWTKPVLGQVSFRNSTGIECLHPTQRSRY